MWPSHHPYLFSVLLISVSEACFEFPVVLSFCAVVFFGVKAGVRPHCNERCSHCVIKTLCFTSISPLGGAAAWCDRWQERLWQHFCCCQWQRGPVQGQLQLWRLRQFHLHRYYRWDSHQAQQGPSVSLCRPAECSTTHQCPISVFVYAQSKYRHWYM